jgi:hypothetical protein
MMINNQGTVFNPILFNAGLPQAPMAERARQAPEEKGDAFVPSGSGKYGAQPAPDKYAGSAGEPESAGPDSMAMAKSAKNVTKRYTNQSSLDLDGYMIPACEGRVVHMCLTYDGGKSSAYLPALQTFMKAMPEARFTVFTDTDRTAEVVEKGISSWVKDGSVSHPERIRVQPVDRDLSIWAQDSTLVIGNKVVEQDRTWFPGRDDGELAGEIAKISPELKYSRMEGIFVDGGNQLATRDTLYVGSDAIAFMKKDMKKYPSKYEKIATELNIDSPSSMERADLAKLMLDRTFPHQKVVIIGYKGEQPSFHIDMAMTPLGKTDPETGKKVVTVGDPSMAVSILKELKERDPSQYSVYGRTILDKLGHHTDGLSKWLEKHMPKFSEKLGLIDRNPLDVLTEGVGNDRKLQQSFDAISKGLERDGCKVERVPYLGSSELDAVPWITYNNAVIDGDNILIPHFEIPELDGAADAVYRKYGYAPVPVDMTYTSSQCGAINCITKVVERSY